MTSGTLVVLQRSERLLTERLMRLQERLQAGDEAVWAEFLDVLKALAVILPSLQPEAGGPLLTTAEMACRLGVKPKTLLRRKKNGEIRPAEERGKFLRWSGQERLQ